MKEENLILVFESLVKTKDKPLYDNELYKLVKQDISWDEFKDITEYLENKDLTIRKSGIILTELGIKKYENIKQKLDTENAKLERAEQKLNFDFKISKFQAEHKFLPYIISSLGLIVSVFALFNSCESEQTPKTQEQVIEKKSIEHKGDSLHISKKQTDTLSIS